MYQFLLDAGGTAIVSDPLSNFVVISITFGTFQWAFTYSNIELKPCRTVQKNVVTIDDCGRRWSLSLSDHQGNMLCLRIEMMTQFYHMFCKSCGPSERTHFSIYQEAPEIPQCSDLATHRKWLFLFNDPSKTPMFYFDETQTGPHGKNVPFPFIRFLSFISFLIKCLRLIQLMIFLYAVGFFKKVL